MTYKERLNALLEEAFGEGYKEGYAAAMADMDIKPGDEDEEEKVEIPDTFKVENDLATRFMAKVYPDGFCKTNGMTYVDEFIPEVVEGDAPSWTEMSAPLSVGSKGQKVRLTLNGVTKEYEGGSQIYNLYPKETYLCEVVDKDGRTLARKEIKTTGTVRMIRMSAVHPIANIRDIGGYRCTGGHMAYGKILRSAFIPDALKHDDENAQILRDLGVTVELDLRGEGTRDDLGWKGYKYDTNGYSLIFTKPANLKAELTLIVSVLEAGGSILMHCYAGADRTGTLAAILQLLCGASESDVIHDWEFTSFCCWYNFKRISDEERNKKEYPWGELRTFMRKLNDYTGDTYEEKVAYWLVRKVGVSSSIITRLKRCLIVKE